MPPAEDKPPAPREPPARLGRKRDLTRDPQILQAALDVLAETGYDGMTIDMVATRAKAGKATLYRRWPTKGDLILAAIACLDHTDIEPEKLPDTGALRSDLLAMINPHWLGTSEQRVKILTGLTAMLSHTPDLVEAVNTTLVEPSVGAYRHLIQRAVNRGEAPPETDVDTLAHLIPSMAAYRTMFTRQPVDRAFLESIINGVLLPAVDYGHQSTASRCSP